MPLSLAQLRRNYTLYGLRDDLAQDDPWCCLASGWIRRVKPKCLRSRPIVWRWPVDSQGHAHCRILLLKGFSAEVFAFSAITRVPRGGVGE